MAHHPELWSPYGSMNSVGFHGMQPKRRRDYQPNPANVEILRHFNYTQISVNKVVIYITII